jgi:hypothetical protein
VLRGFRRFPQLPDMPMINDSRVDIESPFGRHQEGLRNTLRNCPLVHYLVELWPPAQEVEEKRSRTSIAFIASTEVRFWSKHEMRVLSGNSYN